MRFTPSPLFDSFRGKFGLSVFSTNKSNNYVKAYVSPSNPNTTRQVNARNIFSSLGAAWFALSAAARELWVTFAGTAYNPLNPLPDSKAYTGRQAFTALKQCAAYMVTFLATFNYLNSIIRDSVQQSFTTTNLSTPSNPPSAISADDNLYLSDDGVPGTRTYTWDVTLDSSIAGNNGCYVDFTLSSAFQFTSTKVFLLGLGAVTNGIKVYISERLSVEGQKYSSRFARAVIATGYSITGTWAGVTKNTTDITIGTKYDAGADIPVLAGWYYVTLCACDSAGQLKIIGSMYKEVT